MIYQNYFADADANTSICKYFLMKACERNVKYVSTFVPFRLFPNRREPQKPMVYWFRLEKGSALMGMCLNCGGADSALKVPSWIFKVKHYKPITSKPKQR